MKKFLSAFFIMTLSLAGVWGYDASTFNSEAAGYLELENNLIKGLAPTLLTIKKTAPLLVLDGVLTYSLDLSAGLAAAPTYDRADAVSALQLFGTEGSIADGSGETMPAFNVAVNLALFSPLILAIDGGFWPGWTQDGVKSENFSLNGSLHYRVLNAGIFTPVGVTLGVGYGWTSGKLEKTGLSLSYTDGSEYTFTGTSTTEWNYHGLNGELFVHTTFGLLLFYGRADYYYLFGNVESNLSGSATVGSLPAQAADDTATSGLVLSAGLELAVGMFRLNFEAGRDWLSSALYGNLGVRIGL